jgi:hypothetical protein
VAGWVGWEEWTTKVVPLPKRIKGSRVCKHPALLFWKRRATPQLIPLLIDVGV